MTSQSRQCLAALSTLSILISIPVHAAGAPPAAPTKVPGDLWEVTSKVSMEGAPMEMPAQTNRVCAPKEWKEPPAAIGGESKCRTSEFKMEGSKATWKVTCEGPPAITGMGEVTRDGSEGYSGVIKFTSSEIVMTVKFDGHRVGDCDPGKK